MAVGGKPVSELLNDKRLANLSGLTMDSRAVRPGDIFVAAQGIQSHGLDYVGKALANGVSAVLWEASEEWTQDRVARVASQSSIPFIEVVDLHQNVGELAHEFFHHPSTALAMIGITGTNGKTSCAQFVAHGLSSSSRCGVIGTIGIGLYPELEKATMTTPDAITVHQVCAALLKQKAASVVMEVSSHALDQNRVQAVEFDVAVLTNISRDHLDYHGDMAHYVAAKKKLFSWSTLKAAVVNHDDAYADEFLAEVAGDINCITFGQKPTDRKHHIAVQQIELTHTGICFEIDSPWGAAEFSVALYGEFNVMNIVTALSVLIALEVPFSDAVNRLQTCTGVTGRLEPILEQGKPAIFIDYAHTPDALLQSLTTLKDHFSEKIWCVFGCGGDRDQGKRALMGEIAQQHADHIVLTDDNPRTEDPKFIIQQIQSGMQNDAHVIHDRAEAITWAIESAEPKDIILIAGKGHEEYQIIGDQRTYFSDQAVVRKTICKH